MSRTISRMMELPGGKGLTMFPFEPASGYVMLLSVLILGAVGLTITVSLLLLGVGQINTGFSLEQAEQANLLAHTCAEEALQEIRDSTPFSGSGLLTLGQGTCTYSVVSTGGQNRTIEAVGTVGEVARRVRVMIDAINPNISVIQWQEVAAF